MSFPHHDDPFDEDMEDAWITANDIESGDDDHDTEPENSVNAPTAEEVTPPATIGGLILKQVTEEFWRMTPCELARAEAERKEALARTVKRQQEIATDMKKQVAADMEKRVAHIKQLAADMKKKKKVGALYGNNGISEVELEKNQVHLKFKSPIQLFIDAMSKQLFDSQSITN